MNPGGNKGEVPLPLAELVRLREVYPGIKARKETSAAFPGVGRTAISNALAGLPVRPATAELIRLGLERIGRDESDPVILMYRTWLRREIFGVRVLADAHLYPKPEGLSLAEREAILAVGCLAFLFRLVKQSEREAADKAAAETFEGIGR